MRRTYLYYVVSILVICATVGAVQRKDAAKAETTLEFRQTEYVHRWSENDQHEFTPRGQDDLSKWTDMLTINLYREVTDGESLALVANRVLENYKTQRGVILRT